jgi:hypothetical protein
LGGNHEDLKDTLPCPDFAPRAASHAPLAQTGPDRRLVDQRARRLERFLAAS